MMAIKTRPRKIVFRAIILALTTTIYILVIVAIKKMIKELRQKSDDNDIDVDMEDNDSKHAQESLPDNHVPIGSKGKNKYPEYEEDACDDHYLKKIN